MFINFDRSKKMHEMKSPFNYTEKVENSASLSSPSFLFTLLSSSCHRALGDARRRRSFALFFYHCLSSPSSVVGWLEECVDTRLVRITFAGTRKEF